MSMLRPVLSVGLGALALRFATGCATESQPFSTADAEVMDVSEGAEVSDGSSLSGITDGVDGNAPPPSAGRIEVLVGDTDRGFSDGPAELARFNGVTALCLGPDGQRLFIADTFNGTIRRLDLGKGEVSTLAGEAGRFALSDGLGKAARFTSPRGLACLADGLVVADSGALRTVSYDGEVRTVAGFPGQPGEVDGDALEARIGYLVHAMWVLPDGRIAMSDRSNDSVRLVDPTTWSITTLVRGLSGPGGLAYVDATDIAAESPYFGILANRLLVADTFADRLVAIDLDTGAVEPVAVKDVALDAPQGLAFHGGRAWVMGFGAILWELDLAAGQGERLSRSFGGTFASPVHVEGGLHYPELERGAMRRFDVGTRADKLVAGAEKPFGNINGARPEVRFGTLTDLVAGPDALYVSDANTGVKRVSADGQVETVAIAAGATFVRSPYGVALGGERLWVSEPERGRVWQAKRDGSEARFVGDLVEPHGLLSDEGRVYVAETGKHRIAIWDPDAGTVTPFAGEGRRGSVDGPLGTARFDDPTSLAFDASRSAIYVGELGTGRLRRIDLEAQIVETILEGAVEPPYPDGSSGNGPARLGLPTGLSLAKSGGLLLCDAGTATLRRLTEGRLETVAGLAMREGGLPPGRDFPLEDAAFSDCARAAIFGDKTYVAAGAAIYVIDLGDRSW
jgi:sugar lactone lactonase YvrE